MTSNWKEQALRMRTQNNEAIAAAHVDAGNYGMGWLQVDALGNLKRVNPKDIIITFKRKPKQ